MDLVSEDDVKYTRYRKDFPSKYEKALNKHVNWFKEKIEKSKDGQIIIRVSQLTKELGKAFEEIEKTAFYTSVKYNLWQHGIFVSQKEHKDGSPLLVLRLRTEYDELPKTLKKRFEQRYGSDAYKFNNNKEEKEKEIEKANEENSGGT